MKSVFSTPLMVVMGTFRKIPRFRQYSYMNLEASYKYCRDIVLSHYENFPVGSWLIPKKLRKHFYALYAFMRTADDFADLANRPNEERLALLSDWRYQLDNAIAKKVSDHPVLAALVNTIDECSLPPELFYKLLDAFEFDAKGAVRFETFDDLRWYTSRSAEPVGQLVLALFGYNDQMRILLSNDICTALQILNFIQDRKEDMAQGRNYYPLEDSNSMNSKDLSLFQLKRVESLLNRGAPLTESVHGRLRYELRAVIYSARKMISKIRAIGGNTDSIRPVLNKREHVGQLVKALFFSV